MQGNVNRLLIICICVCLYVCMHGCMYVLCMYVSNFLSNCMYVCLYCMYGNWDRDNLFPIAVSLPELFARWQLRHE